MWSGNWILYCTHENSLLGLILSLVILTFYLSLSYFAGPNGRAV